jgi:hypothetical protein
LVRRGREILVSATAAGRRGNGPSSAPALDDSGKYVAFVSAATNLCENACTAAGADRNGHDTDVFRRTLSKHAPTHDRMELATYSYDNHAQYGYGAANPVISAAGENIVYESSNGPGLNVLRTWEFPRKRGWGNTQIVTRHCTANLYLCRSAPIAHPAISSRGNYLGFSSVGVEFCDAYVIVSGGRKACPTFSDVYVQYVGPSHEGLPLG